MPYTFSNKIASLQPSAIREILKATADPSIIPFAAGNPAPDAFPTKEIEEISRKIFSERPIDALQYGVTEGYTPLREHVAEYMKSALNVGRSFDKLIITSGAQQVMDLATKVLCNEGDTVVCETPSFIGSLNCFRSYGAKLAGVDIDSDGMNIDKLEAVLKSEKNVRFIYTIPNFQNPSGTTMPLERRRQLYALAKKYNTLILEDNPYGDLRVAGENLPTIKSMDEDGIVIYAGSFSKIVSPGLRVGFCIAPEDIIAKMVVGKQTEDVHTPMFSQLLVDELISNYNFAEHIEKIRGIYRRKLNLMCDCLDENVGDFMSYVRAQGGLFLWCTLPEKTDMLAFCRECVANKVAVVPGVAFAVREGDCVHNVRLNFSTPSDESIIEGTQRLKKAAAVFGGK